MCFCVSIEVRQAAVQSLKDILATQAGADFWEIHKDNRDPMLAYLNPFRSTKKKVGQTFQDLKYHILVCVSEFRSV